MWRLHFARENWGREQAHHNDDERNEVAADNAAVIGVRARDYTAGGSQTLRACWSRRCREELEEQILEERRSYNCTAELRHSVT
jgi:hypothetical protein